MRKILLTAATAFIIGGIATGAVLSQAQPAPAPAEQMDEAPPPGGPGTGPGHHWMGGWHHHMGPEANRMMHHQRPFALIYRQEDRKLAPADVQKIAEGFLLWNGNHTWKVINVAATPDGPIGFSLATAEGSVIAQFTIDPHTGKIARVG